jgi:hypothetical protein
MMAPLPNGRSICARAWLSECSFGAFEPFTLDVTVSTSTSSMAGIGFASLRSSL